MANRMSLQFAVIRAEQQHWKKELDFTREQIMDLSNRNEEVMKRKEECNQLITKYVNNSYFAENYLVKLLNITEACITKDNNFLSGPFENLHALINCLSENKIFQKDISDILLVIVYLKHSSNKINILKELCDCGLSIILFEFSRKWKYSVNKYCCLLHGFYLSICDPLPYLRRKTLHNKIDVIYNGIKFYDILNIDKKILSRIFNWKKRVLHLNKLIFIKNSAETKEEGYQKSKNVSENTFLKGNSIEILNVPDTSNLLPQSYEVTNDLMLGNEFVIHDKMEKQTVEKDEEMETDRKILDLEWQELKENCSKYEENVNNLKREQERFNQEKIYFFNEVLQKYEERISKFMKDCDQFLSSQKHLFYDDYLYCFKKALENQKTISELLMKILEVENCRFSNQHVFKKFLDLIDKQLHEKTEFLITLREMSTICEMRCENVNKKRKLTTEKCL